jgi:hypothetical protein
MLTMRVHVFIYPYSIKVIIDYTREIVLTFTLTYEISLF